MNYFYDVLSNDLQLYINLICNVLKIQQKFRQIKIKNDVINKLAVYLVNKMSYNFLQLSVKDIENIVEKIQLINNLCKNDFIKLQKNTSISLLHKIVSALEMEEYIFCHPKHTKFICTIEIEFIKLIKKNYNILYEFSDILVISETTLSQIYIDIPEEIVSNDFLSSLITSNCIIQI